MPLYTALHRLLGEAPGALTDEMIDAAITAGLAETDDLEWKVELPPTSGLSSTDFPKDVAAMANNGGGTIVYGVEEDEKKATGRKPVSLSENHERSLRAVAVSAISPPVFALGVHRIGEPGNEVVAVVVPASVDGPHLLYRDKLFGAPIRNDADTEWMKERQIEQMYRARFEERSRSASALVSLHEEVAAGRDTHVRAWMTLVARPRIPFSPATRPTRNDARDIMTHAMANTLVYVGSHGIHPLESVSGNNPRPGLRRWNFVNSATGTREWRESWAAVHHDGSVTIATAIGGQISMTAQLGGWQVDSTSVEAAVADLMGLVLAVAQHHGITEYEVRVAIVWHGSAPLRILEVDATGRVLEERSIALAGFTPVVATVDPSAAPEEFHRQVYELAEDCINQGGVPLVQLIERPPEEV